MDAFEEVRRWLRREGLLLKQDRALPNVVSIVLGASLRGSWWAHPEARRVFDVLTRLAGEPSVLATKLISRKDTFVHERLWPAVLAVGAAREPWQMVRLSAEAQQLLRDVDEQGEAEATGAAARELAEALLINMRQVHTSAGHHALQLEAWRVWAARAGCRPMASAEEGRTALEAAADRLGAKHTLLPWRARRK